MNIEDFPVTDMLLTVPVPDSLLPEEFHGMNIRVTLGTEKTELDQEVVDELVKALRAFPEE